MLKQFDAKIVLINVQFALRNSALSLIIAWHWSCRILNVYSYDSEVALYWSCMMLKLHDIEAALYWSCKILKFHDVEVALKWSCIILQLHWIEVPLYWSCTILELYYFEVELYWICIILNLHNIEVALIAVAWYWTCTTWNSLSLWCPYFSTGTQSFKADYRPFWNEACMKQTSIVAKYHQYTASWFQSLHTLKIKITEKACHRSKSVRITNKTSILLSLKEVNPLACKYFQHWKKDCICRSNPVMWPGRCNTPQIKILLENHQIYHFYRQMFSNSGIFLQAATFGFQSCTSFSFFTSARHPTSALSTYFS